MATLPYHKQAVVRRSEVFASLECRFAAYLIDTSLFFFLQGFVLYFIVGYPFSKELNPDLLFPHLSLFLSNFDYLGKFLVANFYLLVLHWLYYAIMESSVWQATLGKRAMGIKVTSLTGKRISFGVATLRYLGKFLSTALLFGGFLVALFNIRRQALHDLIAGCTVRYTQVD